MTRVIRAIRVPLILILFVTAFLSGCDGTLIEPNTAPAVENVTIVPVYDFGPETYIGYSTSHVVVICAPAGFTPELVTKVEQQGIVTVIDDRRPYLMEETCSDGRLAWQATPTFVGVSLGFTRGSISLRQDPSVKHSFNVWVKEDYYGGRGD